MIEAAALVAVVTLCIYLLIFMPCYAAWAAAKWFWREIIQRAKWKREI